MLIASRNSASANGDITAKSYIQDGLVAMWDGIENAGWGVHNPNATKIKDIVGSNDIIPAQQMEVSSASFVIHENITFSIPAENVTLQYLGWMRQKAGVLYSPGISYNRMGCTTVQDGGIVGRMTITDRLGNYRYYFDVSEFNGHAWTFIGDANHYLAATGSLYTDGNPVNRPSQSWSGSSPKTYTMNMHATGGTSFEIAFIHLYNRALAAEEVAFNFGIDMERFAL